MNLDLWRISGEALLTIVRSSLNLSSLIKERVRERESKRLLTLVGVALSLIIIIISPDPDHSFLLTFPHVTIPLTCSYFFYKSSLPYLSTCFPAFYYLYYLMCDSAIIHIELTRMNLCSWLVDVYIDYAVKGTNWLVMVAMLWYRWCLYDVKLNFRVLSCLHFSKN